MKIQSSDRQDLNWKREDHILLPSVDQEKRMAIRVLDWERLKRKLSTVDEPIQKIAVVYSILFGVSASSGLSIIPLFMSEGLPAWVIPLYGCVCIFSLISAFIFVGIDWKFRSKKKSDIQEINKDFEDIESLFNTNN